MDQSCLQTISSKQLRVVEDERCMHCAGQTEIVLERRKGDESCCAPEGEKPGNEPEEVKLQNASRQIVQNAILQAVRQVSQESQRVETSSSDSRSRCQLGMGELTKKHEKK
ncbi:A-kinase anchor protein inhibitor 1 [Ochotona curzoniae]|uniref:A-kinase anchor protein inhibitor 1 n=1 Tax=Ochotona curzoniae TaxID=130825 RepID=UPI001B3461C5|nr:A-kinase anchor protein inhibitor 1 [Ochotona curzoniae]